MTPHAWKYSRVANNEFEFCIKIYLRASNSPPIGLTTIGYCQNSHMRIIVNQAPPFFKRTLFSMK